MAWEGKKDEDCSLFSFRGTSTAHTVKHFVELLPCVHRVYTRRDSEVWICQFKNRSSRVQQPNKAKTNKQKTVTPGSTSVY